LAHTATGTALEPWLGGAAEERRLGPLGGKPGWQPMEQAAGKGPMAARQRSLSAAGKLLAKTLTPEEQHGLRTLIGVVSLARRGWDVVATRLGPATELNPRDQREVATRAWQALVAELKPLET